MKINGETKFKSKGLYGFVCWACIVVGWTSSKLGSRSPICSDGHLFTSSARLPPPTSLQLHVSLLIVYLGCLYPSTSLGCSGHMEVLLNYGMPCIYLHIQLAKVNEGSIWRFVVKHGRRGVRTTWRCACQVNNGNPQHPCSTSKGLNYNRLLQINRSLKPAIIRMYTISISNCTRWKTILSIVNDWQLISTGENWRPSFHRLGLPQNNGQTISLCFCLAVYWKAPLLW